MANGLGSFYVGAAGLQSAQNALNTTANNFANVDTKGYVRQGVRFADGKYTLCAEISMADNEAVDWFKYSYYVKENKML